MVAEAAQLDGGADRNRTCDLLIANETLYQLSYDPTLPDRKMIAINVRGAQLQTCPG